MRRLGHAVVDRVVDRWVELADLPAGGIASRTEMEARLREPLPRSGMPVEDVLEAFWRDVEPFAGRIDHPRFFAFIPSSPTFPSVLGDWLAHGCNFFQGTWIESAGPSQVELVVIDWLKECFELPNAAAGLLTSGGSVANLIGLAAAREAKLGAGASGHGQAAAQPSGASEPGHAQRAARDPDGARGHAVRAVAYCSDQTHSAVERAMRVLGFPAESLRVLPSDAAGRLDPALAARSVQEDRARGLRPFCVIATAGTTNTGAVDPLAALADLCEREGLWLHVDGAYGAAAWLTERGRRALDGLERADSLVLDPHKWLYVGYEAGCVLVRDGALLRRTFHVLPDYLQDIDTGPPSGTAGWLRPAAGQGAGEDGTGEADANTGRPAGEVNFADYGVQLTRAARALKLWFSLKTFGIDAIAAEIDRTQDLAIAAERRIRSESALELASPASLGIVCFRYVGVAAGERGGGAAGDRDCVLDRINEAVVRRIQREGRFMLSSTRLGGRYVIRLCPLNYRTREEDVEAVIDEVLRVAREEEQAVHAARGHW